MDKRYYIIPVFVPHAGCRHNCIFCNQKSISGIKTEVTADQVKKIIIEHLETLPLNAYIEVAFYGGSFTGIDTAKQEELLEAAYEFACRGSVQSIRISTRPDYINGAILNRLKKYGVDIIELGVQSMDEGVLEASFRGHSREDVVESSRLINSYGFRLGLQMMIGLPGDTPEKDIKTAKQLIELNPEVVRIYPVVVLKGTELESKYNKGEYRPPDIETAVEISKELLKLFKKNGINVIRLGLQATENIDFRKEVAAGPFHPAFRELVESELRYDMITYMLCNIKPERGETVEIRTGIRGVSIVVGHKRSNLKRLYERYGFRKIKVSGEPWLNESDIIINTAGYKLRLTEEEYIDTVVMD